MKCLEAHFSHHSFLAFILEMALQRRPNWIEFRKKIWREKKRNTISSTHTKKRCREHLLNCKFFVMHIKTIFLLPLSKHRNYLFWRYFFHFVHQLVLVVFSRCNQNVFIYVRSITFLNLRNLVCPIQFFPFSIKNGIFFPSQIYSSFNVKQQDNLLVIPIIWSFLWVT